MKLGDRMKSYEHVWRQKLIRRMPVIMRLDGKAFHTFTRGLKKPFDSVLTETMQMTAEYLVNNIQGCKLAYTQSDEISLLITDYDDFETEAWFDNNIQKMVSVAASMASVFFNQQFSLNSYAYNIALKDNGLERDIPYENILLARIASMPIFDARVFNIDKDEVCNYFIWRQEDCIKNAVSMIAHEYFSAKELMSKSTIQRKEMLREKGIDTNSYLLENLRGTVCRRIERGVIIDKAIPIFKEERDYIEKYVFLDDDKNESEK